MKDLSNWQGCDRPSADLISGRHVQLERFDITQHSEILWWALGGDNANQLMHYFPNGPFENHEPFGEWLKHMNDTGTYVTMVFRNYATGEIMGMASYMRIDEKNGVIEVGAVAHGPKIARSKLATEAHFLMARYIFDDLRYRRYEWKLDNNNQPSHKAAQRFGFRLEGIFRKHIVAKGRNRDTAWYAMLDDEWPQCKTAFEKWLADDNFDKDGQQITSLQDIRKSIIE